MVRVSDARMSGTAFGTIVLHVTPDAASGGPLGLVRNGDRIRLSVKERRIDLLVDEAELKTPRRRRTPPRPRRLPAAMRRSMRARFWARMRDAILNSCEGGDSHRHCEERSDKQSSTGQKNWIDVRGAFHRPATSGRTRRRAMKG